MGKSSDQQKPMSVPRAIWQQDLTALRQLLIEGWDCNTKNRQGNTPLHIVLLTTLHELTDLQLSIVRQLIAAGAHINVRNYITQETPFENLFQHKVTNIRDKRYKKLIQTLLLAGVSGKRFLYCQTMLKNKLSSHCLRKEGHIPAIINHQDDIKGTTLMYAAAQGRLETVKSLLREGAALLLQDEYKRTIFDILKIIIANQKDLPLSDKQARLYKAILYLCYRRVAHDIFLLHRSPSSPFYCLPKDMLFLTMFFITTVSLAEVTAPVSIPSKNASRAR
jgi:ankyrin repeat protein